MGKVGWHYRTRKLRSGGYSVISPKGKVVGHVATLEAARRFIRAREWAIHSKGAKRKRTRRR